MKNMKPFILCSALMSLCLTGCQRPAGESSPAPVPEDNTVDVFVLSGQSNMEGSTYWKLDNGTPILENYFEEEKMDFAPVRDGVENVLTSYYGFYYPNNRDGSPKWSDAHSNSPDQSSAEARLTPNFEPTKVGMGVGDNGSGLYFGPELGIANTLSEYVSEDRPLHLIKCAFSGSGFEKTDGPTWKTREDESLSAEENAKRSLYYLLKRYTNNCIEAIEETGKQPIIRGFIWHQGESDTGNSNYQTQMEELIKDFRDDYADYAEDGDGKNIAFLDCTIYDGPKNRYGSQSEVNNGINKLKNNIAAKGLLDENDENYEKNYIVDGTFTEHGLSLEIGDESKGGYNLYHYNTADAYKLGQAYAKIILDHNLI